MKYIFFLLFSLVLCSAAIAGNNDPLKGGTKMLSGKITDASGETIPGAQITVTETGENFYADLDGNYSITLPTDKTYTLHINTAGFQPLQVKSSNLTAFSDLSLKQL